MWCVCEHQPGGGEGDGDKETMHQEGWGEKKVISSHIPYMYAQCKPVLLVPKYFIPKHTSLFCIPITFRYMYNVYCSRTKCDLHKTYMYMCVWVGMYTQVRHQCSHSLMCVNMHVLYMHTMCIAVQIQYQTRQLAAKRLAVNLICIITLLNTNATESQLNTINY